MAAHGETDEQSEIVIPKAIIRDVRAVGGEGSREREFIISTSGVDRDNDTIAIDGWDLSEYRENPVVLFGHDSSEPPVATGPNIFVQGEELRSRAKFPELGLFEFADLVLNLIDAKILRGASVGFLAKLWQWNEERGAFAVDFLRQLLLEWSIVPIPSNPETLSVAADGGLNMAPLLQWTEAHLDGEKAAGLIIPRKDVEDTWKILTRSKMGAKAVGGVQVEPRASADAAQKVVANTGTVKGPAQTATSTS
jgi:hypothetical protein